MSKVLKKIKSFIAGVLICAFFIFALATLRTGCVGWPMCILQKT